MQEQRKQVSIETASSRAREMAMNAAVQIGPERYFGLVEEVAAAVDSWLDKAQKNASDMTALQMATIYTFAYYGMIDVAARIVDKGNVKD